MRLTFIFLGNHRSSEYKSIVGDLLSAYKALGCYMSLKINFFTFIFTFIPNNLGAVSDEHGERFHQDISTIEKRNQGKWSSHLLADYCWTLQRDVREAKYRTKS